MRYAPVPDPATLMLSAAIKMQPAEVFFIGNATRRKFVAASRPGRSVGLLTSSAIRFHHSYR